jgi:tetratricopeptide (TPR) repeat protein
MSWDNHLAWLHYRVGDAALQTGNLSLAVAEFEMCNTLAPFVPDFMNKWGSALFASGDIAKSEKVFTRLLQEDSLFAPAWCNLGYIAFIRGNIVHSEKRLLRATQLQPNYYQAFTNLSRLYESTGEVKKAKLYRGLAEGSN